MSSYYLCLHYVVRSWLGIRAFNCVCKISVLSAIHQSVLVKKTSMSVFNVDTVINCVKNIVNMLCQGIGLHLVHVI